MSSSCWYSANRAHIPAEQSWCPCPQDVLAICGGTLPAWTQRLVFGARFLFPFPLRRAWFKTTALGLPRALAHLQVLPARA